MQNTSRISLEQIRAFLKGSEGVDFRGREREEIYGWVNQTLREQRYDQLSRTHRGLVRLYLEKMTGLSRSQVTRWITRYAQKGEVRASRYQRRKFPTLYQAEDIALLAQVDEAHETLSGPATQKILQRECYDYGNPQYQRLARISVAQIYRLRKQPQYRQRRVVYHKTRPVVVAIGERRRPRPQGRPGYLRVDTVHQGDRDGDKGLYHINAVDEVTQWQIVGTVAQISETALLPVLEGMLEQFPFRIQGFHSDNGSEFINHQVARMLNKLLIEQTKSRPRRSNDNGLVESKNGAVIRKHIGYGYIAPQQAQEMEQFNRQHFNPYLNFHRPCGVPECTVDGKGKERKRYRWYATPWEILRQIPDLAKYLKPETTIQDLDRKAKQQTDTEAARAMQEAKRKLFARFQGKRIT